MRRRRFNPLILHIMLWSWEGQDEHQIANRLSRPVADIKAILASDEAREIYSRLEAQTLETFSQVQVALQAAAPMLIKEKIDLALSARNETVRNRALQDCLELAGHVATRQLEIRRPDAIEEEFKDKSEDEIRREIMEGLIGNDKPTYLN